MKTTSFKPADFTPQWVHVDAAGQTLGRLASQIAIVLRGKNKPNFTPHIMCGDSVIVTNADKIKLTGKKWDDKFYHHHTGYMGGIKSISARNLMAKDPEKLLKLAVRGMLPKNKIAKHIILGLKVYSGAEHPHGGQKPVPMAPRLVK